jgi:iron complex outermembrane receptor protein
MVTLLAGVWASASALVAAEVDAGPRRNFELPAADATVTFRRFIAQAQVQVLYGADEIAGVQTNPVSGEMTAREAAERLVAGTRLRVSVTAPGAMAIRATPRPVTLPPAPRRDAGGRPSLPLGAAPDEPVRLNPFLVATDRDAGYLATNTAAGSRLNTALLDTPASISELTREFLADINANNTMDAVEFSLGFQADRPGGSDNVSQFQSQAALARGLGRSNTVSRDYFPWNLSDDTFSIERLSQSRGPNAILFGIGAAGGIINTTPKRALFRDTATGGLKLDEHGSWRATADVNRRLGPGLALRLNLLREDLRTWREVECSRARRMHLAGTWRPSHRAEVRVDFERGLQDRVMGRRFSGLDFVSPYLAAGAPTYDRATAGNTLPVGISAVATTPRLVLEHGAGAWANWQRHGVGTPPAATAVMTTAARLPFTAVLAGPAGTSDNAMFTGTVTAQIEVRRNFFVELALNESATRRWVNTPVDWTNQGLRIDPNLTAPLGAAHPGQYYVESSARHDANTSDHHNRRLLATYEWSTGNRWTGTHRLVGLVSQAIAESRGRFWLEANLTPLNPAVPALTSAQNLLYRRTYLSRAGVFGDNGRRSFDQNPFAAPGAPAPFRDPANGLSGTITPGWVLNSDTPTRQDNRAVMLAGQSRTLADRLIVTWGLRRDTLAARTQVNTRDPATNAIVATAPGPAVRHAGVTRTIGAVVPVRPWFSLYANQAGNFAPQSALDLDGRDVGNVKGTGRDYGVKLNLLGERLYVRAGGYASAATRQARLVFGHASWIRQIWEAIEGPTGGHFTAVDPTNNVFDTFDMVATGQELEVTAGFRPGLSFTANFATLHVESARNVPATAAYVSRHTPTWRAANPNLPVPSVAGRTLGVALANLDSLLAQDLAQDGREAAGNYRHSLNLVGRYQFPAGALHGWSLGGGYRHRAGRIVNYTAAQEKIHAPAYGLVSAFVDYRAGWGSRRVDTVLRLSVSNLGNHRDHIVTATDATGAVVTGYALQDPRLVTLAVELGF